MGSYISRRVPPPEEKMQQIREEVSKYPVVMYTRTNCGYCREAKHLLDGGQIEYKENDLDVMQRARPDSYRDYVNSLIYLTRQTSVPQIFICGRFIGGFTELKQLKDVGRLFDSISECADQYGKAETVRSA